MKKNILNTVLIIVICSSCNSQDLRNYENYGIPLEILFDSLEIQKSKLSLLIDKSDYKLSILYNETVVKEYPVVFGGNPIDDKLKEGDQCTPEGKFNIVSKYPHKDWSKFIWIDYPTEVSWNKHNRAKAEGTIEKDSKIGGEIGIHGVPKGFNSAIDYKQNWTLGCISLKNKDIEEIYAFIEKDNDIIIQK